MGGQLDGNFLPGSLPHKFIILIVTSFICLWSINFSLSLSLTCGPTVTNRDQLRNPTLGNRVWATLTFLGQSQTFSPPGYAPSRLRPANQWRFLPYASAVRGWCQRKLVATATFLERS